ncbi:MAG: HAD family hydrolase [Actinomycetota bacterium]|nr:HAD family hydrolase [Actinomycetota bacterium]
MNRLEVYPSQLPAIFVDLDGTMLNDDGVVDDESAWLLKELSSRDIRVVVATARSPMGALEAIENLTFDPICICLNGALVIDLQRDEIIYESKLPNSSLKRIVSTIEGADLGKHYLALQHRNSFIIEEGFMDGSSFEIPHVVGEVRRYEEEPSKLILRTESHSSIELHDIFIDSLAKESFLSTSGEDWLDFSPANISKASGAREVSNYYDIDISKCAAIGNDLNDLELLRTVGNGYAVTNARSKLFADPQVRRLASDNNSKPLFEVVEKHSINIQ